MEVTLKPRPEQYIRSSPDLGAGEGGQGKSLRAGCVCTETRDLREVRFPGANGAVRLHREVRLGWFTGARGRVNTVKTKWFAFSRR